MTEFRKQFEFIDDIFLWRRKHLKNVTFTTENVFTTDLSKADVIYIFLMPKLIDKIEKRVFKESKKNAVIISHGFKVDILEKYLVKKLKRKPFPTYFYKKHI